MIRAMLVSGIGLLLALAMINQVASSSLPQEGLQGPYYYCNDGTKNLVKLTKATVVGTNDHSYTFEGYCGVKPTNEDASFRYVDTKIHGNWTASSKTAIEQVDLWVKMWGHPGKPPSLGSINTRMTCQDDPWITNASCTVTAQSHSLVDRYKVFLDPLTQAQTKPWGFPLSRGLTTLAEAAAISQGAGQVPNVPAAKVTILSPTKNQVISDVVKVRVQLPAGVNPADCCHADFWWWQQEITSPNGGKWVHVMSYIGSHSQFTAPGGYQVSGAELRELIKQYSTPHVGEKDGWRVRVGDRFLHYPWGGESQIFRLTATRFQILPPQKRP